MSGDPAVMRHVGGPQSRPGELAPHAVRPGMRHLLDYGRWAVARPDDGQLIGQVGIADFKRDMTRSVEGLPELGDLFAAAADGTGYTGDAVAAELDWSERRLAAAESSSSSR